MPIFPKWHRRWFLFATVALIGVHIYAVVTRHEYEPLYSNYPMYVGRMSAGSEQETDLLSNLHHRTARPHVALIFKSAEQDVSDTHRLAWFLHSSQIFSSPYALLRDREHACDSAARINPDVIAIRIWEQGYTVVGGLLVFEGKRPASVISCRAPSFGVDQNIARGD